MEIAGVIVKKGPIADASIINTPRRPCGRKEYDLQVDRHEEDNAEAAEKSFVKTSVKPNVDRDTHWVMKGGKPRFGYKRHTVTDINGLITGEVTTVANESDVNHMQDAIEIANVPAGTLVYADKGYVSEREKRINKGTSKIRYRVERTYGTTASCNHHLSFPVIVGLAVLPGMSV